MTRIFLATAALAIVAITGVTAQERQPDPARTELVRELHAELLTFARTNIFPALRQWKAKLDGAMSPDDLATLNGLRDRAAKLRTSMMEHGRAMRQAWKSEDYDALRSHRDALKGLMSELRAIIKELRPLAGKYRPALEEIGVEARPAIERWKNGGKEIVARWANAHPDELGGHPKCLLKRGLPMSHMFGGSTKRAVAKFMLWNGDDLPEMPSPERDGEPDRMLDGMLNLD